ncbi:MAG: hypothetical protein HDR01_03440 [Lachnospiraceae bacterium]|nr:hypothetical protein [Lachnospiraceae bacterium]
MKKKTTRFLSLLLAAALLLTTGGMPVSAQTVSGNGPNGEEGEADTSFYDLILEGNGAVSENETSHSEETEEGMEATEETTEETTEEEEDTTEDTVSGQSLPEIQTGAVTGPANPVHHCTKKDDGSDYTDFSYVYFGSYPQSEVRDSATIAAIDKAIAASGIAAEAGTDVWVNGSKYRRISKSDTNYDRYFDGVSNNGYRYFKWERIKWKVLQNNGNTLFVVADQAIDCKNYNETRKSVTWETSTIRNWLNNSFYATAFSSREQSAIAAQVVVNEDNPRYQTAGGNNTNDKVYLLSIGEVTKEEYGFCSDYSVYSMSRRTKASDYANVRGTYVDSTGIYSGNCWWWLRSPGDNSYIAAFVSISGCVRRYGDYVYNVNDGVCPALHINLSSAIWSATDDGTSGNGGEEKIPVSLQASKGKTVYYVGESLNVDDLKVTASYQHHPSEVLKAGEYTTNAAKINMNTKGKKTLTISYTSGGTTRTASITITVKAITKLSLTGPSKKLAAGKKVKLTLKTTPSGASAAAVKWKSSNKKYATVDKNGTVTIKKAGAGKTVTITATARGNSKVKATYRFKIMKHAVKSIKLKAPKKTLKAGKSMTIKSTVKTTGKTVNKTLKWTSSNKKYATVNSKGKVTAKKAGKGKTVTITAKSTDGSNKKATVKIKIK